VLLVARHPEDPEQSVLAIVKGNLIARAGRESITFRLVPQRVEGIPTLEWPPRIEWGGRSSLTADQLWRADEGRGPSKLEQAKTIITTMIAAGQRCASDILAACQAAGISERTYRDARQQLGIVSDRTGFGPGGSHSLSVRGAPQPRRNGS
jgi:hypothetical protein